MKTDKLDNTRYVIFAEPTETGAMDIDGVLFSRSVGSVGVFSRILDGRELKSRKKGSRILNRQTGSEWNMFGKAIAGSLVGRQLDPMNHGVFCAFAWLSFYPETRVIGCGGIAPIETTTPGLDDRPLSEFEP